MPRPAYIAAHSPAGPAPTMITSYGCLTLSLIGPQFFVRNPQLQSRRLGIAGERPRPLLPEPNRLDLDIRPPRGPPPLARRPAPHRPPLPVSPPLLAQRR